MGPNGIAVALAVGGIGLGLLGFGRRSSNALSLIGATLGLAGASWLTIQAIHRGGPVVFEGPTWWNGANPLALSPAAAFFLAFHSLIAVLFCGLEFRSQDESPGSTRLWVAVPIAIAATTLLQDPFAFAAGFMTANVVVTSISGGGGSSFRLFRLIGAMAFVAATLLGVAKAPLMIDGHPTWSIDVAKDWPMYLLGAGLVIPIVSRPEGQGGPAQRMSVIAAPFFLTCVLAIQIGVASVSGRFSTVLLLIVGVVAAWHGWKALSASSSWSRIESLAALLTAIGVYQWINSSSMNAILACFAAFASATLVFAGLSGAGLAGSEVRWPVWSLLAFAGIGIIATLARVLGEAFERATASSTSLTGAAIWLSIAFLLAALASSSASLKNVVNDFQNASNQSNGRWILDAAILSLIVILAGAVVISPMMVAELPSSRSGLVDIFGSRNPSTLKPLDPFSNLIGLSLSLLAVGAGIALPHRATMATANVDRHWSFARIIAAPFALCERIIESLLTGIFKVLSLRGGDAERRAPTPATIIFVAAVAGAAVLLSIDRSGVAAP